MEKFGSVVSQAVDALGDSNRSRVSMLVMILVTAKPIASADALLSASADQSAELTPAGTCKNSFTQQLVVRYK